MRNDKGPLWLRSVAKIIAALIIFACLFTLEFVLNPSGNYSVEVHGDAVVVIEGVTCQGEPMTWHITILETWRRARRTYATLLVWSSVGQTVSQTQELEVRASANLYLPACGNGQDVDIAYIWGMGNLSNNELYMHLRVHPAFHVYIDHEQQIPR